MFIVCSYLVTTYVHTAGRAATRMNARFLPVVPTFRLVLGVLWFRGFGLLRVFVAFAHIGKPLADQFPCVRDP